MAWASKKQYAICMESEEGKDLIEKLPKLSQDEFQVEFGKLLGKTGASYDKNEDEDYNDSDNEDDLPNFLRDADYQEGHDYELDALRERDEKGLNNDGPSDEEIKQEVIENGEDDWVRTEEDKKVWDSLSDDDKYLLAMSNDMGFNFDEMNDVPGAREKFEELKSKFSFGKDGDYDARGDVEIEDEVPMEEEEPTTKFEKSNYKKSEERLF